MVKLPFAHLFRIAPVFALFSCAAPKAVVVGPPPAAVKEESSAEAKIPEPTPADLPPDDGIRLPDMLAMPGDGEFRATAPNAAVPGPGTGAVIARPPTDPPPRPKPAVSGGE